MWSKDLRNGWEGGRGGQRSLGCAWEVRKITAQDTHGYTQGTWGGFGPCLYWLAKQARSHLTGSCCWHATQHFAPGLYPPGTSPYLPTFPTTPINRSCRDWRESQHQWNTMGDITWKTKCRENCEIILHWEGLRGKQFCPEKSQVF